MFKLIYKKIKNIFIDIRGNIKYPTWKTFGIAIVIYEFCLFLILISILY